MDLFLIPAVLITEHVEMVYNGCSPKSYTPLRQETSNFIMVIRLRKRINKNMDMLAGNAINKRPIRHNLLIKSHRFSDILNEELPSGICTTNLLS